MLAARQLIFRQTVVGCDGGAEIKLSGIQGRGAAARLFYFTVILLFIKFTTDIFIYIGLKRTQNSKIFLSLEELADIKLKIFIVMLV